MVRVDGTIAILVIVCEGIEGYRGGAGITVCFILVSEGIKGHRRSPRIPAVLDGLAGERVIRHGCRAHPAGIAGASAAVGRAFITALVGGVSVSRTLGRGILTSRALARRPLACRPLSSCALTRRALGSSAWASRAAVRCLPARCLRIREGSGGGCARDLRRGGIDISFASAIVASISVVSGGRGIGPDGAGGRGAGGGGGGSRRPPPTCHILAPDRRSRGGSSRGAGFL